MIVYNVVASVPVGIHAMIILFELTESVYDI